MCSSDLLNGVTVPKTELQRPFGSRNISKIISYLLMSILSFSGSFLNYILSPYFDKKYSFCKRDSPKMSFPLNIFGLSLFWLITIRTNVDNPANYHSFFITTVDKSSILYAGNPPNTPLRYIFSRFWATLGCSSEKRCSLLPSSFPVSTA